MESSKQKDRSIGAILGTLIGDALGVGPHWYYDLDEMKRDYGEWIDDYSAPQPDRYHAGLRAGQNSQTGQVTNLLLESVAASAGYSEADFTLSLDSLLDTLDGSPQGGRYTDAAMRDVWHARQSGREWSKAGSFADTAEAAVRMPVLAARYHANIGELLRHAADNVFLTHRDPFVAGQSVAFALIVAELIRGADLQGVSSMIAARAREQGLELSIQLPANYGSEPVNASFVDAVLQPAWVHAAANDPAIRIDPPQAACKLFGLACTLGFMLPAAYYFAARFENDFEMAVLSAINGGGNNMSRASLTGALAGAQVGLKGIPERFVSGLEQHEWLIDAAGGVADAARQ